MKNQKQCKHQTHEKGPKNLALCTLKNIQKRDKMNQKQQQSQYRDGSCIIPQAQQKSRAAKGPIRTSVSEEKQKTICRHAK